MNVLGYNKDGSISIEIDGVTKFVPNHMDNMHRLMIAEWEADGNTIPPYVEPSARTIIPSQISDRQFFQQLALSGQITREEARAAVAAGVIPAAMAALIDQIPGEDSRFAAIMLVSGATTFERLHPVAGLIQQLYGWSDEQRDKFWLDASAL